VAMISVIKPRLSWFTTQSLLRLRFELNFASLQSLWGHRVGEILVFKNVYKSYGMKPVLEGFSLTVMSGEVIRLEGPNGSGKTTVLKLASGIERPTRGEVKVLGTPPWRPKAKRSFGVLLHNNMTYPDLTVEENLRFFSKLYGTEPEKAMELASLVGLDERLHQLAGELSFGWRKRLELVRALLHGPRLLLLDEPFVGLDEKGKSDILKLIKEAIRSGAAVMYTAPSGVTDAISPDERVVLLAAR